MADVEFGRKKSDPYADVDLDELLAKLTPEELEKLQDELIDPDVSRLFFWHIEIRTLYLNHEMGLVFL